MIHKIHSFIIIISSSSNDTVPRHEYIEQKHRVSTQPFLVIPHQVPHHQQARHCRPQQPNDDDGELDEGRQGQQGDYEPNDGQREQAISHSAHALKNGSKYIVFYPLEPKSLQLKLTKKAPIQNIKKMLIKSSLRYCDPSANRARERAKNRQIRSGPHRSQFFK